MCASTTTASTTAITHITPQNARCTERQFTNRSGRIRSLWSLAAGPPGHLKVVPARQSPTRWSKSQPAKPFGCESPDRLRQNERQSAVVNRQQLLAPLESAGDKQAIRFADRALS